MNDRPSHGYYTKPYDLFSVEIVRQFSQDNVRQVEVTKRANKTPLTCRSGRSTGPTTPCDKQKEAPHIRLFFWPFCILHYI